MGIVSSVKDWVSNFGSSWTGTEVSASAATTSSNPVYKAIEDLNGRYREKFANSYRYVAFGRNDDIPEVIDKLKAQSTTHAGIINKKAKMVHGNRLAYDDSSVQKGQKTRFEAFYKHCMGRNKGVRRFVIEASYSYEKYGAIPILIRKGDSGRTVSMKVLHANSVRAEMPNENGEVRAYIVRRTFRKGTEGLEDNKPRRVVAYDGVSKAKEQLMYVMNPDSGNPIYGIPSYLSAYFFISADYEFGRHIENSVKNGFTPKVMMTMVGRNMTQEQKDDEYNKIKDNFTGSDGEMLLTSWVRRIEDAPIVKVLDVANLDRTIDVLAKLNDSKILTAHSVTSPTLFGIQVAGKLGGTGTELVTAYDTFRVTETLPNREIILDALNELMETSGYGAVMFEIEDIVITADGADGLALPEEGKKDNNGLPTE